MTHGCHPLAMPRRARWSGTSPTRCRSTASRSTRPRPDLIDKYPTHDDKKAFWRLPTLYKSVQQKNRDIGKTFPLIMTSGRLVEFEGGGEETRSNPWLAELQQEMFVEINPRAANDRGIRNGEDVWVKTPTGAKLWGQGAGHRARRPRHGVPAVPLLRPLAGRRPAAVLPRRARAPVVRGEAVNTGHDLRLRQRDDDAGDQDHGLPGRTGHAA